MRHTLKCIDCGSCYSPEDVVYACRRCGGLLDIDYDYCEIARILNIDAWKARPFGVWRYAELIPVDQSRAVTLNEGGTSLQACRRLAERVGLDLLYVKNEGQNPTGSFKDRGMTVGVSKAIELGARVVICASTGNTSASLSAYAAKAGLRAVVLVPSGKTAFGKLTQAIAYGAAVINVKGTFDDALRVVVEFALSNRSVYLLNSINPYRIEGQKTLAYELYQQLGNRPPDNVILPVGNAGNISAVWKGFQDLCHIGLIDHAPRMIGIQAEGAAPIAKAYRERKIEIKPVECPETIATAIRIGAPVNWKKALRAVYDSGGLLETVGDQEILQAHMEMAQLEGLFVEPASAAPVAGLKKLIECREIDRGEVTVCVATGHGLKDPEVVLKHYASSAGLEVELDSLSIMLTNLARGG